VVFGSKSEMSVRIRRVYEPPEETDGLRVLVDRLWPRGLKKNSARIDLWLRDLAPSTTLRKWFGHDPGKWAEFQRRYFAELDGCKEDIETLLTHARSGTVTLLFAAQEPHYNNAVALQRYLASRLAKPP
jgi:uncharacterized protein YeaO (DUF488 family)